MKIISYYPIIISSHYGTNEKNITCLYQHQYHSWQIQKEHHLSNKYINKYIFFKSKLKLKSYFPILQRKNASEIWVTPAKLQYVKLCRYAPIYII